MDKIIQAQLKDIEEKNNVKILYAVESGSRGWGFESKDSDFDVRFIYVHPVEWYLSVFEGTDIIEIPVDEVLDINGWDLRKALKLMYRSNASLLEWLSSPIIYRQNQELVKGLRQVAEKYFSPISITYHYINIAKKSFDGMEGLNNVNLKKLFYVIRPILSCMWIENFNTIPPMNLQAMMEEVEMEDKVKTIIEELVIIKAERIESDTIKQPTELMEFLRDKLEYYYSYAKNIKTEKERDSSILNEFFHNTIKEYSGDIE
ncbi:nucleotidyltransferase domain-containing protein [Clostridium beijerinckii]|uniref:Nucleotidyltransferase domain-containing protein n=1 Tax=Clostridium beijerinckii TaxID=1520 RepID=A0A7X9SSI0_CLOBE|nr:nucleotidyltransferase domain-containing protein [Clostridium beijerinckii]NMF07077.1 nucleotidyltransferase domain-containing protein [Clostridium beijerinckii]